MDPLNLAMSELIENASMKKERLEAILAFLS
jgi:hypothetical protein